MPGYPFISSSPGSSFIPLIPGGPLFPGAEVPCALCLLGPSIPCDPLPPICPFIPFLPWGPCGPGTRGFAGTPFEPGMSAKPVPSVDF